MSERIDVHIGFAGDEEITDEEKFERGQWLDGLQTELRRELEIDCDSERIPAPENTQDGGLTTAIAIAGLTLGLINTLLAVVKFYNEREKSWSISVSLGNGDTLTKTNLTEEEIKQVVQDIRKIGAKQVKIHITAEK